MYMVYGSYNGGRFKPMDCNTGIQVTNKIYASIFDDKDLDKLKQFVDDLNKDNNEWSFEIRKTK